MNKEENTTNNKPKDLVVHTEEQEKANRAKYGPKDDDFIARSYRTDKHIGDVWCAQNVTKYLQRFIGSSSKSGNIVDLRKAVDYANRMLEANEALLAANPDALKTKEIVE